jgi:hypothetical protein
MKRVTFGGLSASGQTKAQAFLEIERQVIALTAEVERSRATTVTILNSGTETCVVGSHGRSYAHGFVPSRAGIHAVAWSTLYPAEATLGRAVEQAAFAAAQRDSAMRPFEPGASHPLLTSFPSLQQDFRQHTRWIGFIRESMRTHPNEPSEFHRRAADALATRERANV